MQENVFVLARGRDKNLHKIYHESLLKRPMSVIHKNEHNPHIFALSLSALYQSSEKGPSEKNFISMKSFDLS